MVTPIGTIVGVKQPDGSPPAHVVYETPTGGNASGPGTRRTWPNNLSARQSANTLARSSKSGFRFGAGISAP